MLGYCPNTGTLNNELEHLDYGNQNAIRFAGSILQLTDTFERLGNIRNSVHV